MISTFIPIFLLYYKQHLYGDRSIIDDRLMFNLYSTQLALIIIVNRKAIGYFKEIIGMNASILLYDIK